MLHLWRSRRWRSCRALSCWDFRLKCHATCQIHSKKFVVKCHPDFDFQHHDPHDPPLHPYWSCRRADPSFKELGRCPFDISLWRIPPKNQGELWLYWSHNRFWRVSWRLSQRNEMNLLEELCWKYIFSYEVGSSKASKNQPLQSPPKNRFGGNWTLMFCQMWCPRQVQQVHQVHQVLRLSWSPWV